LRSYQSVIILKPDLDGSQFDQAIEKIEQIYKKAGGTVIRLEKWGKKRLAYRIKKHKFGIYLNIYHTCENAKMAEMEREYQLFDFIIKYLIIRLQDKDVERIMKENETASEEDMSNSSPDDNDSNAKKSDKDTSEIIPANEV